jgi:hypothetical protein
MRPPGDASVEHGAGKAASHSPKARVIYIYRIAGSESGPEHAVPLDRQPKT